LAWPGDAERHHEIEDRNDGEAGDESIRAASRAGDGPAPGGREQDEEDAFAEQKGCDDAGDLAAAD